MATNTVTKQMDKKRLSTKKPYRAIRSRYSTTEWASRFVLAILAGFLAYSSVAHSLALVVEDVDPVRASTLAPFDGHILASAAERTLSGIGQTGGTQDPFELAREALIADATAVDAATVIGLSYQINGEAARADRAYEYTQRLSRRNLRSHILGIEQAVERGNIVGALYHFDVALRTSNRAPDILFPVLNRAVVEPKVSAELVKVLANEPAWSDSFFNFVANQAVDVEAAVNFFRMASKIGLEIDQTDQHILVDTLAAKEEFILAWNYLSSFRPEMSRLETNDNKFMALYARPTVFDWRKTEGDGIALVARHDIDEGGATVIVEPGASGEVLSQFSVLPAGRYTLQVVANGFGTGGDATPIWSFDCRDGRRLWSGPLIAVDGGLRLDEVINIPVGCQTQQLTMRVPSNDRPFVVEGVIVSAGVSPS